jgi:hypothetical protein
MTEEARPLANLRPQRLIEGPESTRTELLPEPEVPVVDVGATITTAAGQLAKDSWLAGHWALKGCHILQLFSIPLSLT